MEQVSTTAARAADMSSSPCTLGAPTTPLTPSSYKEGKRIRDWSLAHILSADEAAFSLSLAAMFQLLLFHFVSLISLVHLCGPGFLEQVHNILCALAAPPEAGKISLVKIFSTEPPILMSKKAY